MDKLTVNYLKKVSRVMYNRKIYIDEAVVYSDSIILSQMRNLLKNIETVTERKSE